MTNNLSKIKTIHFSGIKGVGMTSLALCAQDLGIKVSGSDTDETFPTSPILRKRKIKWKIGFMAKNLPRQCDLVIYTGAHGGMTNPEVIAAREKKISTLNHAQALRLFSQDKKTIAVAGVGGKSTTSAMIATVLDSGGRQPSFAVGAGEISPLGSPGRFDKNSSLFVVESDEYIADPCGDPRPRFHYLKPFVAIITNLEHDHPDVYKTIDDVFASFKTFVNQVPKDGLIIANIDNPRIRQFLKTISRPLISYGFSSQADWQIVSHHTAAQKQFFTLEFNDVAWPDFILNVPGRYNILNATATIACCHFLGMSSEKIFQGIKTFQGLKRRFELIGQANKVMLYDDYAHHPIEIRALLKAAKDWFSDKRIIIIFQSHTYSRTAALLEEFASCFQQADQVIINDIFSSARETDTLGINGSKLTQAIKKYHPRVSYCPGKKETIKFLVDYCQSGDVVFTVGAGNNWLWHRDIIKALKGDL